MDIKGKKVLVIGTGKSGIAATTLLEMAGALPILFDDNEKLDEASVRAKFENGTSARLYFGKLPESVQAEVELVVISPGVPVDNPFLDSFRSRAISVWGEVELAYVLSKGDVLAITGTNGKTTTTALVGKICADYFNDVKVVGNIGTPYTSAALDTKDDTVTVAEISSFQLETTHEFHPVVSAILNITPDHLNRHHTMECYIEMKERVALKAEPSDYVILNYDDELTRDFGKRCKCRAVYFSRLTKPEGGYASVYLDDDGVSIIFEDNDGKKQSIVRTDESQLLGGHNVENIMAACAMTICYGIPAKSIRESVMSFTAVEHRIEFVREVNGVMYYNDSKGTNVDAAIKGIQAMNRKTVLIGGGYDKHSEYDEWIESFDGKVKKLVLIGQTAEKIAECARKHGFNDIIMADTFEEAMRICAKEAQPGDAVLLSPACASWGMFDNYEQRGRIFKDIVNAM